MARNGAPRVLLSTSTRASRRRSGASRGPRAQRPPRGAVERSGEADVDARTGRDSIRLGDRQRGVDVTGRGADDDEQPTQRVGGGELPGRYARLLVAPRRYASNHGGPR